MDFEWTPGGDIALDDTGDLAMVTGDDEIALRVNQLLLTWRGEWTYDTQEGFPWWEIVSRGQLTEDQIGALLRSAIVDQVGRDCIRSLDVSIDWQTRTLTWYAELDTAKVVSGEVAL